MPVGVGVAVGGGLSGGVPVDSPDVGVPESVGLGVVVSVGVGVTHVGGVVPPDPEPGRLVWELGAVTA